MHLAQNLKYLREQKGINQRALSDVLGVSTGAVGNWEASTREPDLKTIIRLAEYFGVTLDDLVLRDLKPPVPLYVANLRFFRVNSEMTQEDMAKLLGVSKASYCKYENGAIDIGIERLTKFVDFFGVTLDQMVKQDLSKEGV